MAYKCENCGSTNIKVDFKVAYTSLPEQYGYCCQDCGEFGFVNREEDVLCVTDEDVLCVTYEVSKLIKYFEETNGVRNSK